MVVSLAQPLSLPLCLELAGGREEPFRATKDLLGSGSLAIRHIELSVGFEGYQRLRRHCIPDVPSALALPILL